MEEKTGVETGGRSPSGRVPERRVFRVAFFSGGTGGHLTPALAVAEALRRVDPSSDPLFFTAGRKGERALSFPPGTRRWEWGLPAPRKAPVRFSFGLVRNVRLLKKELKRLHVRCCVGMGGYASVPGVLAARACGIPVVLLEQNRIVGRANRLLAPLSSYLCTSYPDTTGLPVGRRAVWTGNPVRTAFLELRSSFTTRPVDGLKQVLVLGGSQGAAVLDRVITGALPKIARLRLPVRFVHAAGPRWEEVARAYKRWKIPAQVAPFFNDIASHLAGAAIAFARAGGCTVAELLVLGVPAVLVPYPAAADRHQHANARYVEEHGAGLYCDQEHFTEAGVVETLCELCRNPQRWEARAERAWRLGVPEAAERVVKLLLELSRRGAS